MMPATPFGPRRPARAHAPLHLDPFVTVLVPARNEARSIEQCIAAVAAQDYDHDRMEVVVVVGTSTDGTEELARRALQRHGLAHAKVIENPVATTPNNLNTGLAASSGEILCRVDARSLVPTDYVSRCVSVLTSLPQVAVTGGAQVTVTPAATAKGQGIARALNNRWGMGLSRYRRGAPSGPADTVYLGAFRTDGLRAAGGWNEQFPTNQDFELNRRMGRTGTVWFDSELEVGYIPRSTVRDLFRQYRRFGNWKVRYWRTTGDRPRGRQLALLTVPVVAGGACTAILVRRPYAAPTLLAAALVAGIAVEVKGAHEPYATSPAAHAYGVAAMGAVASGWLLGVWEELLRHRTP